MKEKLKSAAFWASAIGAVFLILGAFGVEIGDETASDIINAVCSVLVMLGIVTPPKKPAGNGGELFPDLSDGKDKSDTDDQNNTQI